MAKDLLRRIERIEQHVSPAPVSNGGLMDQIFRDARIPAPSRWEFSRMLRQVIDQIDGRARLIPGEHQLISKEN